MGGDEVIEVLFFNGTWIFSGGGYNFWYDILKRGAEIFQRKTTSNLSLFYISLTLEKNYTKTSSKQTAKFIKLNFFLISHESINSNKQISYFFGYFRKLFKLFLFHQ